MPNQVKLMASMRSFEGKRFFFFFLAQESVKRKKEKGNLVFFTIKEMTLSRKQSVKKKKDPLFAVPKKREDSQLTEGEGSRKSPLESV